MLLITRVPSPVPDGAPSACGQPTPSSSTIGRPISIADHLYAYVAALPFAVGILVGIGHELSNDDPEGNRLVGGQCYGSAVR